jgi:two-component system, NarL family, nitrate/nitrite response regulator NarL
MRQNRNQWTCVPPSLTSHRERTVLIVDDHVLFAQALELALTAEGYRATRLDFPDTRASSAPLMSAILQARPDVLLLDLDLGPHGDGRMLIEPASRGGIDVVVVTGADQPGEWARAVDSGARIVLSKAQPLTDVVSTVRRLMQGLPVMSRGEREQLVEVWAKQRADNAQLWDRFDQLTMRECEVLGQLMQGHSVRGIAEHSFVAETTVRTQVKSILAKLEVSSQLAAVGLAYRIGWQAPFERPFTS